MTVTVNITEADIKNGWMWSYHRLLRKHGQNAEKFLSKRCQYCPVAIAMNRTFGTACITETYRLHIGDKVVRCPEVVSDWMYEFDCEREAKPFAFDLMLDDGKDNPGVATPPTPDPVVPQSNVGVVGGGDVGIPVVKNTELPAS